MRRRLALTATVAATCLLATACGGITNTGDTATGPAGSVTTDGCTDPAAATKPITGAVKIGWTVPLSGPFQGVWTLINDGFGARMKAFNAAGGANGVTADFFTTDSKLDPEVSKAMGNEMVQKDGADIISTTGTAQVATMIDDAAAACVPFLAATSSSPIYHDTTKYPWATLYLPQTDLETKAVVKAIERQFPNGATVAVGKSPSETGSIYTDAFKKSAQGTNVKVVAEASVADPNAAATTLKASGADVLFGATSAQECLALTTAIGRVGWKPTIYYDTTCADTKLYAPAGAAADNAQVFKYEVLPALPQFAGTPAVKDYLAAAKTSGLKDPMSNWSVTGWSIGEVYADVLTRAAKSPEGLTRLSIMKAAQDQDFHPSTFISGIDYHAATGGVTGMQPFRWDAAAQQFALAGDPVIIN